jgi:hypothetical protein
MVLTHQYKQVCILSQSPWLVLPYVHQIQLRVPSVLGPRHNLPRCIFARCHCLISLLPLLLPLFRCKTFWGPGMNSRNFGLQCSINQPMSCQCCLLLKLGRYYDCRKCLTTATCNSDQEASVSSLVQWRGRVGQKYQTYLRFRHA